MTRRILRAAVLGAAIVATAAACGHGGKSVGSPNTHIAGPTFDSNPCSVYTFKTLTPIVRPVLARAGWLDVGPIDPAVRPDPRLSADMQRCRYPLGVAHPDQHGDPTINVTVYDEMTNGRALMDMCKSRGTTNAGGPTAGPVAAPLGDESCLDVGGQWRFRLGDRYVSVAVDIRPRTLPSGYLAPSDTTGREATYDPQTQADVSRVVAEDLLLRLR